MNESFNISFLLDYTDSIDNFRIKTLKKSKMCYEISTNKKNVKLHDKIPSIIIKETKYIEKSCKLLLLLMKIINNEVFKNILNAMAERHYNPFFKTFLIEHYNEFLNLSVEDLLNDYSKKFGLDDFNDKIITYPLKHNKIIIANKLYSVYEGDFCSIYIPN